METSQYKKTSKYIKNYKIFQESQLLFTVARELLTLSVAVKKHAMLVHVHWKALKWEETQHPFIFENINFVSQAPYARQSDSWVLNVWGWLYCINSNENRAHPLYGTRSLKVHAIHICFQFLWQISVYYFVKREGKQHQHHLNDVAHIVDKFW